MNVQIITRRLEVLALDRGLTVRYEATSGRFTWNFYDGAFCIGRYRTAEGAMKFVDNY